MKNIAMLGAWHVHAGGYAKQINAIPGCRVVKVWDTDDARAKAWAEDLGCEAASVEDILADQSIEGVVICNATNEHTALMLRAINAGKAVFTEKVLALTNEEAEEIKAAVLKNGTRFAISFPHLCGSEMRYAIEKAKSGVLGVLNYGRVRNVHNGSIAGWLPPHFYDPIACGGGAMIDLGAHPMYTLSLILGEPKAVKSTFTKVTGKPVEDNAVSVLEYENGAIGVSETGFVSTGYPYELELGGDKGALMIRGKEVTLCAPETDNKLTVITDLPAPIPQPIEIWASGAEIPEEFGIEAACRLTRVMVMAYKN